MKPHCLPCRYINGVKHPDLPFQSLGGSASVFLDELTTGMSSTLLDEAVTNTKGSKVLRGSPAAQGTYVGYARVIQTTSEFGRIRQGDVVVIPFTNSSFNVVMKLCGAIVTMHGGSLSHAGIVSREMGIACVTDCSSATELIADGQKVEVNGTDGTVTLLDAAPVQSANKE